MQHPSPLTSSSITRTSLQPGMSACTARSSTAPRSRCSRDSGTYGSRKMGRMRPHIASAVLLRKGGGGAGG